MVKTSKGLKYTRRGAGMCSLRSMDGCRDTEVIIPEEVWFKGKVVEIDSYAFRDCSQIKRIVIPEGVTEIGDYAFENCQNLESVILPRGLKTIGRGAFSHCGKLKNIELPLTVTVIADGTFAHCYSLTDIDLPHVRAIGEHAFAACDSLSNIVIGNGVEEIDATSFLDSGLYKHRGNWKGGLLYVGKWVVGCNGIGAGYTIEKDTAGIASNVFVNEWHVKRTANPMYAYLEEQYQIAMVCPQVPIPDLSDVPEFLEEIIPVRIQFEGTVADWQGIVKLHGEKKIPASVTADDGTVDMYL